MHRPLEVERFPLLVAHHACAFRNPHPFTGFVAVHLRLEQRQPVLGLELPHELVPATGLHVPLHSDVLHHLHEFCLACVTVKLHQGRVSPQHPPLGGGLIDAFGGVFKQVLVKLQRLFPLEFGHLAGGDVLNGAFGVKRPS